MRLFIDVGPGYPSGKTGKTPDMIVRVYIGRILGFFMPGGSKNTVQARILFRRRTFNTGQPALTKIAKAGWPDRATKYCVKGN
ncbi:MAG TPA: hypothetical protein PLE48_05490 [Thiobacillus sp.]|nr:hypothetical protein [Thiobacillus sp.]